MSKWKQRDGTMIDMKDMTTEHLENAIKMLERVAEEGRTIRYGGGSDIQDFYYDEEFLQGKAFLDTVPEYKKLKKELKTRKKGNELKRLRVCDGDGNPTMTQPPAIIGIDTESEFGSDDVRNALTDTLRALEKAQADLAINARLLAQQTDAARAAETEAAALRARVAELEAAQAWHFPPEVPKKIDRYEVLSRRGFGIRVRCHAHFTGYAFLDSINGRIVDNVICWRALLPMPQEGGEG